VPAAGPVRLGSSSVPRLDCLPAAGHGNRTTARTGGGRGEGPHPGSRPGADVRASGDVRPCRTGPARTDSGGM